MDINGRRESDNVEDARGGGGGLGGVGVKGGIGSIILALVLWAVFGINPSTTLNTTAQIAPQQQQQSAPVQEDAETQHTRKLISVVLADTEDTWGQIFKEQGGQYVRPKMVLFRGSVRSGCGMAESAMGPFYCPADQKVYLDLDFFKDMRTKLGISGDKTGNGGAAADQAGDFAQAYVVAHEIGHHVQKLLGISEQVSAAMQQAGKAQANELSVRQELQADCFAGVWANRNQQRVNFLQPGDLEEALNAATQIGDDRLQQRAQGYVVPESFTHGSSAQRVHWFQTGLQTGNIKACDTFGQSI